MALNQMTDRQLQTDAALGGLDNQEWYAMMRWATPQMLKEDHPFFFEQISKRVEKIKAEYGKRASEQGKTDDSKLAIILRDVLETLGLRLQVPDTDERF